MGETSSQLPLVSVIIPTYNRAEFLDETIESVLVQDYDNVELIVLDDGSIDHTPSVLQKYSQQITVERHANMGETLTVNKGFLLAKGRYICVVNSDDPVLPGLLRAGVVALERNPTALAAYPDWREIGPRSERIRDFALPDYTLASMLQDFDVRIGPGVIIRREALTTVGLRDPALSYTGDLDFWFRAMLRGPMVHIPRVLATHRVHAAAASATARDARMAAEVVRLAETTLSDPNCPRSLVNKRRQILSRANLTAMSYCGANNGARRHHRGAYLRLYPLNVMKEANQLLRVAAFGVIDNRHRKLWAVICFLSVKAFFWHWTARKAVGK
jgi:GT2 family glycosyltransferase